jgi:hypothetical protein
MRLTVIGEDGGHYWQRWLSVHYQTAGQGFEGRRTYYSGVLVGPWTIDVSNYVYNCLKPPNFSHGFDRTTLENLKLPTPSAHLWPTKTVNRGGLKKNRFRRTSWRGKLLVWYQVSSKRQNLAILWSPTINAGSTSWRIARFLNSGPLSSAMSTTRDSFLYQPTPERVDVRTCYI